MQCTTSRNWCGRRHKFRHTCAQRTHGNPHLRTCPPRWCRGLSSGRAASRCGPRLRSWFLPTCPHTVSSYRHHPRPQHKHMCRRRGIAAATRAQAPAPVSQLQVSGHDICRFFTSGAILAPAASGNRSRLNATIRRLSSSAQQLLRVSEQLSRSSCSNRRTACGLGEHLAPQLLPRLREDSEHCCRIYSRR